MSDQGEQRDRERDRVYRVREYVVPAMHSIVLAHLPRVGLGPGWDPKVVSARAYDLAEAMVDEQDRRAAP